MAWTVFKMIQHTTVFYTCIQQYFSQAQCWQPWCWQHATVLHTCIQQYFSQAQCWQPWCWLVATALVELCVEGTRNLTQVHAYGKPQVAETWPHQEAGVMNTKNIQ